MSQNTTIKVAEGFTQKSRTISRSTKVRKTPGRVFGTSSQFKGVGVGVRGDVRK